MTRPDSRHPGGNTSELATSAVDRPDGRPVERSFVQAVDRSVQDAAQQAAKQAERAASGLLERSTEVGLGAGQALHGMVMRGGEPVRRLADLLHGTWLGHPLHPVLTDITIGAWTFGALFDGAGVITGDRRTKQVADRLTMIGTASAIPTALAGITDYSTISRPAARNATAHALLNGAALGLYALSLYQRRRGRRGSGVALSAVALGANMFSAWLGGNLVYRDRVGVDHSERFDGPQEWTAVAAANDLAVGESTRVELDGKAVLLYRDAERVYALGARCSHAGGPLDEGEIRGCFVRCPWHDSVFDIRDGSLKHGPATSAQPALEARLNGSEIEVRAPARR